MQLSRHPKRPYVLDHIERIFTDFQELHGDRRFKDDAAIVGGPAFLDGKPVMVIGQQKGRNTKDNLKRNFGCPPEGYRKAMRLMEMADKFDMPIVMTIDTPGAYPGIGAEERHVEAIAVNIRDMSALKVPIISIVIGEGGQAAHSAWQLPTMYDSRKRLLLGDFSRRLCRDFGRTAQLHRKRLRRSRYPTDLIRFGVVDQILKEPVGGAHRDYAEAADTMKAAIVESLSTLAKKSDKELLDDRYDRYRKLESSKKGYRQHIKGRDPYPYRSALRQAVIPVLPAKAQTISQVNVFRQFSFGGIVVNHVSHVRQKGHRRTHFLATCVPPRQSWRGAAWAQAIEDYNVGIFRDQTRFLANLFAIGEIGQ